MTFFGLMMKNIFSSSILFFITGILLGSFNKKLRLSQYFSTFLSYYLLAAIGFKGGIALSQTQILQSNILIVMLIGMLLGFLQPFLAYTLLKRTTSLDKATAIAVAAHYGSISIMTFATAVTFLELYHIKYASYILALLALMEAPAIVSALIIAHTGQNLLTTSKKMIFFSLIYNHTLILLSASFIIGFLTPYVTTLPIGSYVIAPFPSILTLFLFDMGLIVARNLQEIKKFTWPLILFGFYMPLIGALLGLITAWFFQLDLGTGTLFIVLTASASYIAVPACMRLALPEAKAAIYLPMSLAITFPFNLAIGIPLYYLMAKSVLLPML